MTDLDRLATPHQRDQVRRLHHKLGQRALAAKVGLSWCTRSGLAVWQGAAIVEVGQRQDRGAVQVGARRRRVMATLVYKYGAWAPFNRDEAQTAREIMVRANKHYNALVRAENIRRKMAEAGVDSDALKEAHHAVRLRLRSACGLRHGTYLAAEDAAAPATVGHVFDRAGAEVRMRVVQP